MTKQILTKQAPSIKWVAYYADKNGNPTSDRVGEGFTEKEAKEKLKEMGDGDTCI